ncbi:MAG: esterase/lipase superfamily enzyme [Flavobacteriales bacterium]|jgi:esterase/lipase superfamily enzyme
MIMKTTLYFATNRKHEGANQWNPTGYGKDFSNDGHYNLRFGELSFDVDELEVNNHLTKTFKSGRKGDGEELSKYLAETAKGADISSYEDVTATTTSEIKFEKNSSTLFFKRLKKDMENNSDALIYIHGYNVSWNEAVGGALALQYMLNRNRKEGGKKITVVLFSWPSDGSMMPYAAYKSDRSDARDSAQAISRGVLKLRDFLTQLKINSSDESMKPCGYNIHLLAHSMGNYVLQNALSKIIGYSNGNRMPRIFENIFLCAGDVDDNCLEENQKMGKLPELCNHISVYHNKGDIAMYISDYTKGNAQRLGNTGAARPQLIHNKIHQINCSDIVKGFTEHSYYLWATVNDDISMTLNDVAVDSSQRKRKQLANSREWLLL